MRASSLVHSCTLYFMKYRSESCMVQFLTWIRILGQKLLINQSNNTEHKFSGLEALFWSFVSCHWH